MSFPAVIIFRAAKRWPENYLHSNSSIDFPVFSRVLVAG
jgi:hypothetical protein